MALHLRTQTSLAENLRWFFSTQAGSLGVSQPLCNTNSRDHSLLDSVGVYTCMCIHTQAHTIVKIIIINIFKGLIKNKWTAEMSVSKACCTGMRAQVRLSPHGPQNVV